MTRLLETPQLFKTFRTELGSKRVLINLPFWCHSLNPFWIVPTHHLKTMSSSGLSTSSHSCHLSSAERESISILSELASVVNRVFQPSVSGCRVWQQTENPPAWL